MDIDVEKTGTSTERLNGAPGPTANQRLKESFSSWLWGAIAAAAVLHFAVMAFWPSLTAADYAMESSEMEAVEIPPEVEIPPPPEDIPRPSVPTIGDIDLDDDITIEDATFDENPVESLPPPPSRGEGTGDGPAFTPYEVAPEMRNPAELQRLLERAYPSALRDAGVGGTTHVWLHIDENGNVIDTRVSESSGQERLDQAAMSVMDQVTFTPALNRDEQVPVWVQFPVTWRVD